MVHALIIDDEPASCDALRTLLRAHPEISVRREAGTLAEARIALASTDYQLVFLDIQLIGGTGFDLVPLVRPGARIIFVTAYDRHAVRAFEVNALDYLLKPVAPARLAQAIARVIAALRAPAGEESVPTGTPARLTVDDRVLLKLGAGHERFVRVADIRCIASNENYTEVFVGAPAERLLVRRTLRAWEDALPAEQFVRVHRQTVANLTHARGLQRQTDSVSHLTLAGMAAPVSVSNRYLPALRERLVSAQR
jgi:two-component system LytT family response regulator